MVVRSLWFEPHLFADRAGRRARAACERLEAEDQERILAAGDRLALVSPAVAQAYYRTAAAVWETLGPTGFDGWVQLGEALLVDEPRQRDAALAFFAVPAERVAVLGLDGLDAWCAIGRQVATTSRRLATIFFQASAPLLWDVGLDALTAWADTGRHLHGRLGWHGEFLAQAYFAATPHALPVIGAGACALWADLGVLLHSVLKESQFFGRLPDGFTTLSEPERTLVLSTALRIGRAQPAAAAAFYGQAAAALRRLPAPLRTAALEIFALAGPIMPSTVPEVVPVAGALIHDVPRRHRAAAVDFGLQVARAFPRGALAALRSLPIAYEDAPHEAVAGWVQRGLEVAAENADAGVAYFALESRTSRRVLEAGSTAVTLQEVQGLLRKYIQMLSGRAASLRAADGVDLRSPLEEFPLEDEVVLPLRIDLFATHEDNTSVYRFLAAQLAGRREFGTYDVDLADGAGTLLTHLRDPTQPPFLEDLFLVVEGFRVGAALSRAYPGLAGEQREFTRRMLARLGAARLPSQAQLFDALLVWLLSGTGLSAAPAWLQAMARVVAPCVAPLAGHDATPNDALAVARLLARQFAEAPPDRLQAGPGGAALDALSDDGMLGHYLYDYDAEGPSVGAAGDAGTPPAETPAPAELPENTKFDLQTEREDADSGGTPLSAQELQRLIEAGIDLRLKQGYSDDLDGLGLYITDLLGKLPSDQIDELRRMLKESAGTDRPPARRWLDRKSEGTAFYYDEWDHQIGDYRPRWCRLRELPVDGDSGEFFNQTLTSYAQLIPEVRRQFQRIRPEMYRIVRGLEDGEDFDLNAVVNARVDRRARRPASSKLYTARVREERDVATLFLIDMSASTDEPLEKVSPPVDVDDDLLLPRASRPRAPVRRIIDVTKEALVIMAEALEEIGDAYAIYGFSGHGRENVEFYLVKSFNESLTSTVKGRIGALEPKRSTRMGTALRHATEKMGSVNSRSRHVILLSDGFPQDFDYGQDRRSNVYGLRDTTVALREMDSAGINAFCITVDKAGHDYLREMCESSRYMVIDDITQLPRELPKIYQRVVTT